MDSGIGYGWEAVRRILFFCALLKYTHRNLKEDMFRIWKSSKAF